MIRIMLRTAVGFCAAAALGSAAFAQQHDPVAHSDGLGRVQFQTSCTPEAQKQFERALAIDPDHVDALIGLSRSLAQSVLIPSLFDQNLYAQSRRPMDMMRQGWSTILFQAAQQWSRMSG